MSDMTDGAAIYYDGLSARARRVTVELRRDGATIVENGAVLAHWRDEDLRREDAPNGRVRFTSVAAPDLARLELPEGPLAAQLLERAPRIKMEAAEARRSGFKIVGWSLTAAASILLTVFYLIPQVADRLAPLVPLSVERRLGDAVDNQVRSLFGENVCAAPEGKAALAALTAKMIAVAPPPMPIEVVVLRSDVSNALAAPGGRIYFLSPMIEQAQSLDELAGVLAHEMGHVANRDGMRGLLKSGGSSFVLGLLFGDVTGGAAIILLSQQLVSSAYSREAETLADAFAADAMNALGRSAQPLGTFLTRISSDGRTAKALAMLSSHPLSGDRLAALSAREPAKIGPPLLTDAEWATLKKICAT